MKKIAKLIIFLLCLVCINVNADECEIGIRGYKSEDLSGLKVGKKLSFHQEIFDGFCDKVDWYTTGEGGSLCDDSSCTNGYVSKIKKEKGPNRIKLNSIYVAASKANSSFTLIACPNGVSKTDSRCQKLNITTGSNSEDETSNVASCKIEFDGEHPILPVNNTESVHINNSDKDACAYVDWKIISGAEFVKMTKSGSTTTEFYKVPTGESNAVQFDAVKEDGEVVIQACPAGETQGCQQLKFTTAKEGSSKTKIGTVINKGDIQYKNKEVSFEEIPYCQIREVVQTMKIINKVLTLIKICIPVLLVIMATVNLAKVLLEDKDDVKNYVIGFISKFIIGVLVYLLPSLFLVIYSYAQTNDNNYLDCVTCVINEECPEELYCLDNDGQSGHECSAVEMNTNCDSVFGSIDDPNSIAYYMQYAFNMMKYIGIVLCIVLSAVDVVKYILSGDKDGYKSVVGKIIKRLCYACVLVFLPNLVEVVFKLLNLYGTCGIK